VTEKLYYFLLVLYIEVSVLLIVIVHSRFLQQPQKWSRGNQLIHNRLTKTKSISGVKIWRVRQADGYGWWCWALR